MNIYNYEDERMHIPLTIEKQLENYALHRNHTERHAILWHTWKQNQTALKQLLEYAALNFQSYSRHDASHSDSVIHNIERILGEKQIGKLSPTDCFCLLHVAYIHDIGMCLTNVERKKLFSQEVFSKFIEEIEAGNDQDLIEAVNNLKRDNYSSYVSEMNYNALYNEKLNDYNSLILVISEFQRKKHGDLSAIMADGWEKSDQVLNSMCIPQRIYKRVAHCAKLHTDWNFNHILTELEPEEDGFVSDTFHPRFIAVMLQLGDLLDLDNNRFNPFILEMVDPIPKNSLIHYNKHKSIIGLHISQNRIFIEADCESISELRQLRMECDWIKNLLQASSYHWSEIEPEHINCKLPSLSHVHLMLKGKDVPASLVTAKFEISQNKAFGLLQGTNIYDTKYVFIRELLQNASDASKIQYWEEIGPFINDTKMQCDLSSVSLKEAISHKKLSLFPIKIIIKLGRQKGNKFYPITEFGDCSDLTGNVGLMVSVQDYGTGISERDLNLIAKVGTSREEKKRLIDNMPDWLKPSGCFGIGLQSLFNLNNHFYCITRTRSGEAYEIDFSSGTQNGMINVTSLSNDRAITIPYGSCVSIFISEKNKISHSNNMIGWSGMDPLDEDYVRLRPVRRSYEMLIQFINYVNEILGESLFPIDIEVAEFKINDKLFFNSYTLETLNVNKLNVRIDGQQKNSKRNYLFDQEQENNKEISDYHYHFNIDEGKLTIWSNELNSAIEVAGKQFLSWRIGDNDNIIETPTVCVRYKGLKVEKIKQSSMISGVDIKAVLNREYLELNRSSFTALGKKYLIEEFFPKCETIIEKVLGEINRKAVDIALKNRKTIVEYSKKNFFGSINRDNVFAFNAFEEKLLSIPIYEFSKLYLDNTLLALNENEIPINEPVVHMFKSKYRKKIEINKDNSNDDFDNALEKVDFDKLVNELQRNCYLSKIDVDNTLYSVLSYYFSDDKFHFLERMKNELSIIIEEDFVYKIVNNFINDIIGISYDISKNKNIVTNGIYENIITSSKWIFGISLIAIFAKKGFYKNDEKRDNIFYCLFDVMLQQLGYACTIFFRIHETQLVFPNFFNFQIYKYDRKTTSYVGISLPTLLSSKVHFGVFSERHFEKMQWNNYLVLINNEMVSMINNYDSMKFINEREKLSNSLEDIVLFATNGVKNGNNSLASEISFFLLRVLPSVALAACKNNYFKNSDLTMGDFGNERLNVISFRTPTGIFMSDTMNELLINRILTCMDEKKKTIPPRLRTTVSLGYEPLVLDSPTTNLISVNIGFISQKRKTILLPFSFELESEKELIRKIFNPNININLNNLKIDKGNDIILKYGLENLSADVDFINKKFTDIVTAVKQSVKLSDSENNKDIYLLDNYAKISVSKTIKEISESIPDGYTSNEIDKPSEELLNEFCNYVIRRATTRSDEESYKDAESDIKVSDIWSVVLWLSRYFNLREQRIYTLLSYYLKDYLIQKLINCNDFIKMSDYVIKNAIRHDLSYDDIRNLYSNLIYEYSIPIWKKQGEIFEEHLKGKEISVVSTCREYLTK